VTTRAVLAIAFAAGLPLAMLPASAAGPATPPPAASLRHMVFGITVLLKITSEARGVYDIATREGATISNSTVNDKADGQIVCDVVGATADKGLILDITENSDQRRVPTTRVALQANGLPLYTQGDKPLNEEELVLLKLLARGVIGADPRAAGDSWTVENNADKYTSTTTFHVSSVPSPTQLNLNIEEIYASTAAPAYSGVMHGSIAYDPRLSVPESADLQRSTRSNKQDGSQTVVYTLDYKLQSDSFAGK
jgi:hypothetical protein